MTNLTGFYGEPAGDLGVLNLPDWHELMHYLYLPVRIPARDFEGVPDQRNYAKWGVPKRLMFLMEAIERAMDDAAEYADHLGDPYVYVTARRGFASPYAPLNREGWHCDDFGGTDLNYIWSDRYPTRQLVSDRPLSMIEDDVESMERMTDLARYADEVKRQINRVREQYHDHVPTEDLLPSLRVTDTPASHLLRLTPWVIHNTPDVPQPGGMRSFIKVSVSDQRYDLRGNSHNHLIDYSWPMKGRAETRNQPQSTATTNEEPAA